MSKNLELKFLPHRDIPKTLHDRLQELKKTDDLTMIDYLLKIRSLGDNLIESGSSVTNREIINYCLMDFCNVAGRARC